VVISKAARRDLAGARHDSCSGQDETFDHSWSETGNNGKGYLAVTTFSFHQGKSPMWPWGFDQGSKPEKASVAFLSPDIFKIKNPWHCQGF
jgi:hypothetical protein